MRRHLALAEVSISISDSPLLRLLRYNDWLILPSLGKNGEV